MQGSRQLQRGLPAQRDHHALGLLDIDDVHNVLEGQRLEIQLVGGIVVGRHGLGIAVNHDRLVPGVAKRIAGMHAAVIELDALPDTVRPGAQDHDALATRRGHGLVFVGIIGLVVVCRGARELGGAGVDRLERGHDAELLAASTHLKLISPGQMPDLHVG